MQKKISIFITLIGLTLSTLSAQERLNSKGVYVKVGTSSFENTKNNIAGNAKPSLGVNAGFFLEKIGEDAKIGWKTELGVKLQGLKVDFPAQPEFNLPHVLANDFGLRVNWINYAVYRPVAPLRLMFGLDPSIRLMNYKSIHFKTWGYQSFALGYVAAVEYALNNRISIDASYAKDNLLPTIYQKNAATFVNSQIMLGVAYKIK